MRALSRLSRALKDPRLEGIAEDSPQFLTEHQKILKTKPMMRNVFLDFYHTLRNIDQTVFTAEGKRLEVGAGVSFFKEVYSDVLVTDLKQAAHLDQVVDAQNLPFKNDSLRAIYGINCFHHFPDVKKFFAEVIRCTPVGGGAILIEPYYGRFARLLYKHLHHSETFDANQAEWSLPPQIGPQPRPTNQALSYIVFVRDRKKFEAEFPDLELVMIQPFRNYLQYLLSGGLNFHQLVPDFLVPGVRGLEFLLSPFQRALALHHVIVIRKKR